LQEYSKRQGINERIEEHKAILERKKKTMKEKNEDFLKLKEKHEVELQELLGEKSIHQNKRMKLAEEVQRIQKEISDQEINYQDIITDLSESVITMKKRTGDLEKNTAVLQEEFRTLTKELEKKEAEAAAKEIANESKPEIKKTPLAMIKRTSTMAGKRSSIKKG